MGNHGGGIPPGGSAKAGNKGVGGGSADTGSSGASHGFHAGDHVSVRVGGRSIRGRVKAAVGLNHVHVVPKSGRRIIAHVRNVTRVPSAHVKAGKVRVRIGA